jgi:hypothetical protein
MRCTQHKWLMTLPLTSLTPVGLRVLRLALVPQPIRLATSHRKQIRRAICSTLSVRVLPRTTSSDQSLDGGLGSASAILEIRLLLAPRLLPLGCRLPLAGLVHVGKVRPATSRALPVRVPTAPGRLPGGLGQPVGCTKQRSDCQDADEPRRVPALNTGGVRHGES